jgi:putative flippase GtrA
VNIFRRLRSFSIVGTVAFIVDFGLYNFFAYGLGADVIPAKILSVAAATAVSWAGSRYVTFRELGGRSTLHETLLFALTNLLGLGIAAGCLYVSHYLLGYTSVLADNVAGSIFGVLLGNVFRYFAYRYIVFQPRPALPSITTRAPTVERVHA